MKFITYENGERREVEFKSIDSAVCAASYDEIVFSRLDMIRLNQMLTGGSELMKLRAINMLSNLAARASYRIGRGIHPNDEQGARGDVARIGDQLAAAGLVLTAIGPIPVDAVRPVLPDYMRDPDKWFIKDEAAAAQIPRKTREQVMRFGTHELVDFTGVCTRCGATQEQLEDNVVSLVCGAVAPTLVDACVDFQKRAEAHTNALLTSAQCIERDKIAAEAMNKAFASAVEDGVLRIVQLSPQDTGFTCAAVKITQHPPTDEKPVKIPVDNSITVNLKS